MRRFSVPGLALDLSLRVDAARAPVHPPAQVVVLAGRIRTGTKVGDPVGSDRAAALVPKYKKIYFFPTALWSQGHSSGGAQYPYQSTENFRVL